MTSPPQCRAHPLARETRASSHQGKAIVELKVGNHVTTNRSKHACMHACFYFYFLFFNSMHMTVLFILDAVHALDKNDVAQITVF